MIFLIVKDIDALFGNIWRGMRQRPVKSVDAYVKGIEDTFKFGKLKVKVVDIYIIPHYKRFLHDHIDNQISNYSKELDTQLQWCFEAVEPSVKFPLGCRTCYRAFSADKIVEFKEVCFHRLYLRLTLLYHNIL